MLKQLKYVTLNQKSQVFDMRMDDNTFADYFGLINSGRRGLKIVTQLLKLGIFYLLRKRKTIGSESYITV